MIVCLYVMHEYLLYVQKLIEPQHFVFVASANVFICLYIFAPEVLCSPTKKVIASAVHLHMEGTLIALGAVLIVTTHIAYALVACHMLSHGT